MDQFHSNTIETSRKPGKHLTLDERGILQALHQQRHSLRYIATIAGCVHTTIYNEIRRERPILKVIVGVDHSIQPSVGRKPMTNTGNTLGNLWKASVMIANHTSRGW